jgi:hypothetical protein
MNVHASAMDMHPVVAMPVTTFLALPPLQAMHESQELGPCVCPSSTALIALHSFNADLKASSLPERTRLI